MSWTCTIDKDISWSTLKEQVILCPKPSSDNDISLKEQANALENQDEEGALWGQAHL